MDEARWEQETRLRQLEGRVSELEGRLRALRAGRRVLMTLLEQLEERRRREVAGLLAENRRLSRLVRRVERDRRRAGTEKDRGNRLTGFPSA